jgi:hypothetical protein
MSFVKIFYKLKIVHVLLLGLFLSSCSGDERMIQESEIMRSLEKIIEDGKKIESGMKFNLESLQAVEWDNLYIFGPYTPTNDIEQKLGANNVTVKEIDIEARDDINLLVFMLQSEVIVVVSYPRQNVDFSPVASGTPILKEESFFNIVESADEKEWFYVEFAK